MSFANVASVSHDGQVRRARLRRVFSYNFGEMDR